MCSITSSTSRSAGVGPPPAASSFSETSECVASTTCRKGRRAPRRAREAGAVRAEAGPLLQRRFGYGLW